jgi:lipopolysaccharide biosynthesis glycosyltransferase
LNEINIGFQLDPGYILRTMMTLASLLDSQNLETKIRLHFAVVLNFTAENMIRIYSLRKKIRDDVEFNFYNSERVEIDFKGIHPKGPGAIAKIILPNLLPDDVDRIILFDSGDLLVLRDLREMYNWDMGDYLYLGTPDPCIGKDALISKKPYDVYINIGHFLLNVKKIKEQNMYEKFLKYKDVYTNIIADQDLLNDVAQNKIGYLPVRFGLFSPFINDKDADDPSVINQYEFYQMTEKKT